MLRTILCLTLVTLASATEWMVGWQAAVSESVKTGKPILALFTGSDFCPPCKVLHDEVFDTKEFAAWAKSHVVLLEVDLPLKSSLSEAQQEENKALEARFNIAGYPTTLIMTADGTVLGSIPGLKDYVSGGGPTVWIPLAQKLLPTGK